MLLFDQQKMIYSKLNVPAITSKAKIYDYIPENVKMPFIVIGDDSAIEHKTKTFMGYETTSTIYVWGEERSMKNVKTLLSNMANLLSVDSGKFEFHALPLMSATRESVEYVKGKLQVKYRVEED